MENFRKAFEITIFLLTGLLISKSQTQLINEKCYLRCPVPLQVDVKCGSNGVSYQNMAELLCAKVLCYPGTDIYLFQLNIKHFTFTLVIDTVLS